MLSKLKHQTNKKILFKTQNCKATNFTEQYVKSYNKIVNSLFNKAYLAKYS